MNLKEMFIWYSPAETRLPFMAYLQALLRPGRCFAADLKEYLGADACIVAGSGRTLLADLLIVLKRADVEARSEVLIPGYTCYSVAAAVARTGLAITVYDVDPATFEPDLNSLQQAISKKTLAVVGQHLFGIPAPLREVRQLANLFGAMLIDDAAQGLGGRLDGHALGAQGDFGLFSFGRGKPMPLGCGGALIFQDPNMATRFPSYSKTKGAVDVLMSLAVRVFSYPIIYGMMEMLPLGLGRTEFKPDFHSGAMPAAMQRLGSQVLRRMNSLLQHRRLCADTYHRILGAERTIQIPPQAEAVYPRFPVLANAGEIPCDLYRLGVRRMYPQAILDEPAIKSYLGRQNVPTPGAARIARDLITLPTHLGISKWRAEQIAGRVRDVFTW